ncbi:hypothetical protein ACFVUS_23960 [Nocardia sp. NPDC058058]|uniref:hypothetical protein n=1 Tax=Nocardia sp. NPDC058058 TaxID=3346317 RepID=UPI0036DC2D2F
MTFVLRSAASALAIAAVSIAAPTASALPTGSFGAGDGRQVVIVDGTLELSDLNSCWASGFPRDIRFENRSSRNLLVFGSKDCTGEPIATVPANTSGTYYGWSAIGA